MKFIVISNRMMNTINSVVRKYNLMPQIIVRELEKEKER
jgi:hypothetical protein